MPTANDIMQMGALGVLLIINLLAVVKGVPWIVGKLLENHKIQNDGLVAAFRAEIQAERDSNARNNERLVTAIERNTTTVESLRSQVMGGKP